MIEPLVHMQPAVQADSSALRTVPDTPARHHTERALRETAPEADGLSAVRSAGNPAGGDSPAGGAPSLRDSLPGGTDSLAECRATDSAMWGFPGGGAWPGFEAPGQKEPIVWRDTTAQAIFGDASLRVLPAQEPVIRRREQTGSVPFQCFVLLLAATYAVLLYRNLGDIGSLLNRSFHDAHTRKWASEDSGSSGFSHFLNVTTGIGLLFIGLLAVKFGGGLVDGLLPEKLSGAATLLLSLATTLAGGAVVLYQRAILRTIGAITLNQAFVAQLIQLRRTCFALIVVITAPVLLLFVLCPADSGRFWFYFLLLESALTIILYIKKSLDLFLSKNFSILLWFLYLCAVEFFPISLLWLLITRGEGPIQ